MQQAIPYKAWALPLTVARHGGDQKPPSQFHGTEKGTVREAVTDNPVIVLARQGCCMSHVVKRLLNGHGVNPTVFEFEEDEENGVVKELIAIIAENDSENENKRRVQFPAVFIGGRLFGGLDQVMATHISGELIPALKQAGALWL